MSNIFKQVQMPNVSSNQFNLSHDIKFSFNMGELVPTTLMDVVPGDKVEISVENMLRFAPLIAPVMHKVDVTTHYFFVPNRILWSEWDQWITGNTDVEPPYIKDGVSADEGTLADYMGIYEVNALEKINALPISAYAKIYDEYYRDQNLQSEVWDPLVAGENIQVGIDLAYQPPLKRAWQHDYFTSALPWAQKGDAVTLPLTSNENVKVRYDDTSTNIPIIMDPNTGFPSGGGDLIAQGGTGNFYNASVGNVQFDPNDTLEVDINEEAVDITTLRRAFRLQEWLEKNARGGTRYIENIMAHFGVRSSDARLQRPEYIGGSKQHMVISEVLSTAQTEDSASEVTPIGQMAGHGISVGGGKKFRYRATEHGWIMGIISVRPQTAYQNGLHRMFSRPDRLDYFWPSFQHIGEQEIKNKEIFAPDNTTGDETFGYIPRYSEYKYINSRVAGKMRTNLSFWHLGRIFGNTPALNADFIECDPSRRIFAVEDPNEDTIYAHVFNNIKAIRKMARYGTPHI